MTINCTIYGGEILNQNINKSADYYMGYSNGFYEGYNKLLEFCLDLQHTIKYKICDYYINKLRS